MESTGSQSNTSRCIGNLWICGTVRVPKGHNHISIAITHWRSVVSRAVTTIIEVATLGNRSTLNASIIVQEDRYLPPEYGGNHLCTIVDGGIQCESDQPIMPDRRPGDSGIVRSYAPGTARFISVWRQAIAGRRDEKTACSLITKTWIAHGDDNNAATPRGTFTASEIDVF